MSSKQTLGEGDKVVDADCAVTYPKRDAKFDVTDINAKDEINVKDETDVKSETDDNDETDVESETDVNDETDANDETDVKSETDASEEIDSDDGPVIETEFQMYMFLYGITVQAWLNRNFEKANKEARQFIFDANAPITVQAGSHRILADAPGSFEDQLMHAQRSLELHRRIERNMDENLPRENIMLRIESCELRVKETEAALEEARKNPRYYTEEELDEMEGECVRHWRQAYFPEEEEEEEEDHDDEKDGNNEDEDEDDEEYEEEQEQEQK